MGGICDILDRQVAREGRTETKFGALLDSTVDRYAEIFLFFGVGAYVMVLSFNTLPFWASVILAGLVGAALALLVGYPCLRVRGPYFVILTFGLAELVKFIVVNVEAALGQFGRLLLGTPSLQSLYYMVLILALIFPSTAGFS